MRFLGGDSRNLACFGCCRGLFFLLLIGVLLIGTTAAWSQQSLLLPQAQTFHGVTVHLAQVQWQPLAKVMRDRPGIVDPYEALVIIGKVHSGSSLPPGKTETDFLTVSLLGPQGQRLHGYPLLDQSGWYFSSPDPQWKSVIVQFEFSDPSDAPGADFGNFQGSAAFRHVASPPLNGPPVTVHQTQATAHGTQITLEKIRLRELHFGAEVSDQMQLLLTWKPPSTRPATRIRFTLDGHIEEENGGFVEDGQGDGSEANGLDSFQDRQTTTYTGTPFTLNLHLMRLPANGIKMLNVSVNYWELAPELRRPAAFTDFVFPISLALLKPPPACPRLPD